MTLLFGFLGKSNNYGKVEHYADWHAEKGLFAASFFLSILCAEVIKSRNMFGCEWKYRAIFYKTIFGHNLYLLEDQFAT